MKPRSIVMLSGGLDSAVALFWAIDRGHEVASLTFDYFHRSRREIQACIALSNFVNCSNRRINLEFLKEIDDSKKENRNGMLSKAQSAYVPCRNVIYYGIAASFAEISNARYIVGGHNKNDSENFPDSSQKFFDSFNETATIGRFTGDRTGKVILPFAKLDKSEVIKLGSRLNVPFELTWSCYTSNKTPCKKCLSCKLRAESFEIAGLQDPLVLKEHS
ncbi:MAG TPA: 7-cyano-7-deazaguanine synthase [Nitrososphaerales archaeon]|nr:7-cyano-7-deazaguanine synthase [Nitrososphaerales archaeon]